MRDAGLAALTGLLVILIFPLVDFAPLAWVALVPLLAAIERNRPGLAFRLGFLSGVLSYAGILYWLVYTLRVYGYIPYPVSVPIVLLLILYLSLYTGAFAAGTAFLCDRGFPLPAVAPVLWVALEYLRTYLLSGFPWAVIGYSQHRLLPFVQIAELTSVYGVSFLIVGVNAVFSRMLHADAPEKRRGLLVWATAATTLVCACLGFGFWRLNDLDTPERPGTRPLTVALIQGNIPQELKWDNTFKDETIGVYRDLTAKAAVTAKGAGGEGPDLVVWPETAAPFYFQSDSRRAFEVRSIARDVGVPILFGCPAFNRHENRLRYLNRAYLLSDQGEVLGFYDKLHLVLFGEYNPLPVITKLVSGAGDFSPGEDLVTFRFPGGAFGVVICFEGIFPALDRRFVAEGAELLVNITNDAWFGKTSAPYQHLAMVTFRAVENRVPVVRAANTGVTAVIDVTGRITARTAIFERDFLVETVRVGDGGTFYTRHGDLFAQACSAAAAILLGIAFVRARRERP